ncbi:MAG TPA: hypothetical protein GXX53_04145 [Tissierellia bacterium]|nr:hypothetical protein [Tissierellia bacterium]
MKKKILALLTIILILVSISTAVFAGDPGGGISIPPPPIRDSIVDTE